jgi:hypothetical protein
MTLGSPSLKISGSQKIRLTASLLHSCLLFTDNLIEALARDLVPTFLSSFHDLSLSSSNVSKVMGV